MTRLRPAFLAGFALIFFSCAVARAATVVPVSDEDLAVSARAIVEGRVVATEPTWSEERRAVVTYVTVDVEVVYKGDVAPGLAVLAQLGGRTARWATDIPGAPVLDAGDRVLLFLNTDRRGALRVAQLSLGTYEIVADASTGRDLVVRRSDAAALDVGPARGLVTDVAAHDTFVASLRATLAAHASDVARAEAAWADVPIRSVPAEYSGARTAASPAGEHFTLLEPGFRWFEPDVGGSIPYRLNGAAAPTPSRGLDESRAALAAWSQISGSKLRLVYAGKSSGGGHSADGFNEIAFGDPLDEIDDPVNCTGVVASGGVTTATGDATSYDGASYHKIIEGDVVVNDGFECLISNSTVLMEILTHELGHTLGVGHSSERLNESNPVLKDATMFFAIHNDGRGASLRADDSNAIRSVYGSPTSTSSLDLVTTALPDALPGVTYGAALRATGGTTPYVWSVASGALPPSVSLAQDGRLAGTPSESGAWTFEARLGDASGAVLSRAFTVSVTAAPSPFLTRATFDAAKSRLAVNGLFLGASASVEVNGVAVAGTVRFKAAKGRVSVSGSSSRLNLRGGGADTVVVVVDGRRSNALAF